MPGWQIFNPVTTVPKPGLTVSLLHKGWKWNVHQWCPNTLRTAGPTQLHMHCRSGDSPQPTLLVPAADSYTGTSSGWETTLAHTRRAVTGWTLFTCPLHALCWPSLKEHTCEESTQLHTKTRVWTGVKPAAEQAHEQKHPKNKIWSHNTSWSLLTAKLASSRRWH